MNQQVSQLTMKRTLLCVVGLVSLLVSLSEDAWAQRRYESTRDETIVCKGDPKSGVPTMLRFTAGDYPDPKTFTGEYRLRFGLSEDNELRPIQVVSDDLGFMHHRVSQFYKGVEVLDAQYVLHEKDGVVTHANGTLIHDISLETRPTLTEKEALIVALAAVGATAYIWEDSLCEAAIKRETGDASATFFPSGGLRITTGRKERLAGNCRLVYRFDVYARIPRGRFYVDIDAQNGDVMNIISRIHHVDVAGTGQSQFNGVVPITVDRFSGSSHRLRETTTRGADVTTLDMQNGSNYGAAVDFIAGSANGPWDATGVSAHFAAEAAYDYYLNQHGRNSLNNGGMTLFNYVHASDASGNPLSNAYWDGSRMTYGDGNGTTSNPFVSLDVVGHELTHGVTEFTANLTYQLESGALNESFSDIFGNLIEFGVEGRPGVGTGSWLNGEDITVSGFGFRDMRNPNTHFQPDTYGGDWWFDLAGCIPVCNPVDVGYNDCCGVHTNSGVQNLWFVLLAEGGTGVNDNGHVYDVQGIGIDAAAAIAYRNLTSYLTSGSDFQSARDGSLSAAEDLYGSASQHVQSVADAWNAVGVYDSRTLVWVDFDSILPETGGIFFPYRTLRKAVANIHPDGTVRIKAGSTSEAPTVTFPVRLEAPDGDVTIGQQ